MGNLDRRTPRSTARATSLWLAKRILPLLAYRTIRRWVTPDTPAAPGGENPGIRLSSGLPRRHAATGHHTAPGHHRLPGHHGTVPGPSAVPGLSAVPGASAVPGDHGERQHFHPGRP